LSVFNPNKPDRGMEVGLAIEMVEVLISLLALFSGKD